MRGSELPMSAFGCVNASVYRQGNGTQTLIIYYHCDDPPVFPGAEKGAGRRLLRLNSANDPLSRPKIT